MIYGGGEEAPLETIVDLRLERPLSASSNRKTRGNSAQEPAASQANLHGFVKTAEPFVHCRSRLH